MRAGSGHEKGQGSSCSCSRVADGCSRPSEVIQAVSSDFFFPSPSLKVCMCVSCVRKGYYQCVQECARETHSPWFKIHRAIQQLERGAAERGGRRVPVSSPESRRWRGKNRAVEADSVWAMTPLPTDLWPGASYVTFWLPVSSSVLHLSQDGVSLMVQKQWDHREKKYRRFSWAENK